MGEREKDAALVNESNLRNEKYATHADSSELAALCRSHLATFLLLLAHRQHDQAAIAGPLTAHADRHMINMQTGIPT
ncbi:conserved hypothetical protein [Ricinus communis]|uniref:Uncharacterized protein n=1 Tax=Ricinus communis TaxID=3988 RepID=B9SB83_RICCO|nr:conserved hypothetical protein [Ricinus communis]